MKTYQCKEKGQQEVKAGRMEISKGRARVNKTAVILFFSFKIWSFQIVQTVWEADTHLISTTGLLWGLICYLICLHFRSLTVAYCFQQFVVCSVCCSRRLCAHTASSVKHGGGSVMAWVCVAARGTGVYWSCDCRQRWQDEVWSVQSCTLGSHSD